MGQCLFDFVNLFFMQSIPGIPFSVPKYKQIIYRLEHRRGGTIVTNHNVRTVPPLSALQPRFGYGFSDVGRGQCSWLG